MNIFITYKIIKINFKIIVISWIIGIILGVIVILSIPKEYTTQIVLAPETSATTSYGLFSNLLSINENSNLKNLEGYHSSKDAIYPKIYPLFFESDSFQKQFLKIEVSFEGKKIMLKNYLLNNLSYPWWYKLKINPTLFNTNKKNMVPSDTTSSIFISEEEMSLINILRNRIALNIDKRTNVITVRATFQNPLVAAEVADAACNILKNAIIDYRTNKSEQYYLYIKGIQEKVQSEYYIILNEYNNYLDSHHGNLKSEYRAEKTKLRMELNIKERQLRLVEAQLQDAHARVMEERPVFAVIEPAIIPHSPSYPKTMICILGFLIASTIVSLLYIFKNKSSSII